MSHLDPSLVDVRPPGRAPAGLQRADELAADGRPGSVTAGRYGLLEYRVAPHSPGAAPHFHRTFSESFYVLSGGLTVYHAGAWEPFGPGDYALVHEGGRTASATTATRRPPS